MRIRFAVVTALALAVTLGPGAADALASHCSNLQATLTGPPIGGVSPQGKATWKGTPQCTGIELRVEVRSLNLPDGTPVTLETCGLRVTRTVSSREVRFDLKTTAICNVGGPTNVLHGTTTVASGTWCNPLFQRCQ